MKCKECEYFDTAPNIMKWGVCRKISDATAHLSTFVKGPDSICNRKGTPDIYQPVVKEEINDL